MLFHNSSSTGADTLMPALRAHQIGYNRVVLLTGIKVLDCAVPDAAEKEQKIRERAARIWELEGRPQGRDKEHWRQAQAEIEEEFTSAEDPSREAVQTLDNPAQPITPEHPASAARDIVAKLVTKWREAGLPSIHLAEALIDAGLEQVSSARGPAAAVSVLQELIRRISGPHQTKSG
jgi:Protein of unknown function (DUF2934)